MLEVALNVLHTTSLPDFTSLTAAFEDVTWLLSSHSCSMRESFAYLANNSKESFRLPFENTTSPFCLTSNTSGSQRGTKSHYKPRLAALKSHPAHQELIMPQQNHEVSIHYEYWKADELRRSAKQRHIHLGSRKPSRKALICALRRADRECCLDRFLRLPIELRLQVYEAYCSDCTTEPIFTEATPPLARANRQLRSEFLPVFDKECAFGVSFSRLGSATLQTQSRLLKLLNAPQSTLLLDSPRYMGPVRGAAQGQ